MTISGSEPSQQIRVKEKTVTILEELKKQIPVNKKTGRKSVHDVIKWLVDYYYTESGTRRPLV